MTELETSTPLRLTIPYPNHIPRARGIHSTSHLGGEPIRFRCSRFDQEAIERASDKCGMSISAFVRWCSVRAAMEILEIEGDPNAGV